MSCTPCQPPCCTPLDLCVPENFGLAFPSLVGPMGPPGGPGAIFENLAALRLIDASAFVQGYIGYVAGFSSAGDGGGGNFQYNATSTAADDGGTVISPANGIGRWYRIFSGPYNLKWFGAKGDGVTVDTAAFILAFAALGTRGGTIYCPIGTYLFNAALSLPQSVSIVGDGQAQQRLNGGLGLKRPTRLLKSGNFTGITLNENCSLEKLTVDGLAGNVGDGVVLTGARTHLRDVGVFEMGGIGIRVEGDANSWQLENVTSGWNTSHGIYVHSGTNNANIGSAIDCLAWTNGGDGWRINSTFMSMFSGCYSEANTGYGWRVMVLATVNNFHGCGGENNGTEFVFEAGSINNAFTGASRNYYPTDSGENSIFHASGGESGRKGWAGFGLARMGAASAIGVVGAFQTLNGYGAHGDALKLPGYYWWDLSAPANQRAVELYYQGPTLLLDFMDDNGGNRMNAMFVTRAGTGAAADAIIGFNSRVRPVMARLGVQAANPLALVFADNAAALAAGLVAGQLYRASGTGAAAVGTVMVVYTP